VLQVVAVVVDMFVTVTVDVVSVARVSAFTAFFVVVVVVVSFVRSPYTFVDTKRCRKN
jgi:hypothetical protein